MTQIYNYYLGLLRILNTTYHMQIKTFTVTDTVEIQAEVDTRGSAEPGAAPGMAGEQPASRRADVAVENLALSRAGRRCQPT